VKNSRNQTNNKFQERRVNNPISVGISSSTTKKKKKAKERTETERRISTLIEPKYEKKAKDNREKGKNGVFFLRKKD